MNIAAGVLLIIAAIFNVMAGCTYAVGGAIAGGVGDMADEIASNPDFQAGLEAEGAEMPSGDSMKAAGAGLATWGFALFG